jgi:hypothetical protein
MTDLNYTDPHAPHAGWVSSGRDRGSIDILWSCCLTIVLCCWVATHPNALGPNDKSWHRFLDKLCFAFVGLLGPDFLYGIALGQFCSARRSVKIFKRESHLCNGAKWSLSHAFLVEMGGIHLKSPDFEQGFPINNTQLHYLVKHKYIDFPDISQLDIDERNTVDTLARFITMWQAVWFFVTEVQRLRDGLPMTTLELTALSFVFVMVATEICWFRKPSPMKPRAIRTKNNRTIAEIRERAKNLLQTHPDLADEWYRTPLAFIDGQRFQIDTHWSYYCQLGYRLRISPSRPVTARPWDRIPSDVWLPLDKWAFFPGGLVLVVFSMSFLAAWSFYFPSNGERVLWHVASIYHAFFGVYGGAYYLYGALKWHRDQAEDLKRREACRSTVELVTEETQDVQMVEVSGQSAQGRAVPKTDPASPSTVIEAAPRVTAVEPASSTRKNTFSGETMQGVETSETDPESLEQGPRRHSTIRATWKKVDRWLDTWRNLSADGDPDMEMKLKVVVPVTMICFIYIVCRLTIFVHDFSALREQPVGVYETVNKFIPFMGD